jgi:hypothetical protein
MQKQQQTLHGRFRFEKLGGGNWRATNLVEPHERLFLHELEPESVEGFDGFSELSISWQRHGTVGIVLRREGGSLELRAASAFVHEHREGLYAGLELPRFSAPARRFWSRIFRLVRLPGGRLLLGWIARRSRSRR